MGLEREPAGLERAGFSPNIIGGGIGTAPPMIKDARDVIDPIRLLDDAKKEIVVLCAIKLRTEPADFPHKIAPDDREMADVVTGKKIVRRPVRLENRRVKALLRELVLIGVNQICVSMILEPLYVVKERIGFENVIVIEKTHPLTFRNGETAV